MLSERGQPPPIPADTEVNRPSFFDPEVASALMAKEAAIDDAVREHIRNPEINNPQGNEQNIEQIYPQLL